MIEVVVALFILAVGLLGVLAMQANGIKGNQRAGFSTDAYLLAQDMADRIQAYNDIDDPNDDNDYDNIDLSANIPADPGCAANGCSRGQQVTLDQFEWGTQLARRLPGGSGKVDYDTIAEKYTVTVMWDGNQDGSAGINCTGAAGQLLCFSVEFKL